MATSTQIRAWWADHRCKTNLYERVGFPGAGRTWDLLVAAEAASAFRLLAQAMTQTGYLFRESAGGTYNCRKIAGSTAWSLHAYGIALDLNPSKNPFGLPLRHDFPAEFITLVEGIRTGNGKQTFTWGGRWSKPDAMHFQLDVSPTDLATGLVYPEPPTEEDMPLTSDDIRRIWEYPVPDEDDGLGTRGAVHALRQAWGYSLKASVDAAVARRIAEQGTTLTPAQIEAIADAVTAEVADDVADEFWQRLRD